MYGRGIKSKTEFFGNKFIFQVDTDEKVNIKS